MAFTKYSKKWGTEQKKDIDNELARMKKYCQVVRVIDGQDQVLRRVLVGECNRLLKVSRNNDRPAGRKRLLGDLRAIQALELT